MFPPFNGRYAAPFAFVQYPAFEIRLPTDVKHACVAGVPVGSADISKLEADRLVKAPVLAVVLPIGGGETSRLAKLSFPRTPPLL